MAEIREEVIVDVKVESADTQTRVDELTRRIAELRADTDKLSESNKKLAQFGKENTQVYRDNSQGIEINKRLIQEATQERRHLIDVMLTEDKSVKALQLRNKELIKQRNEISTATEEGRAKIALLNKEIDSNNAIIQANVSELEKQKINIGNYASALDGVIPGMSGYVQGTQQMITVSRTFIATPIGAVIGALGLALGALIAYFKGTEEGQDRWNKVVQVGSALLGKFMDFVRDIGEAIVNTFSVETLQRFVDFIKNDLIDVAITNLTNRFKALAVIWEGLVNMDFKQVSNGLIQMATGVEGVVDKAGNMIDAIKETTNDVINSIRETASEAVRQGQRVADLQRELRLMEREHTLEDAKLAIEVAKLREKSYFEEGKARRETLEEAIALQMKIADNEVEVARKRLELAQAQWEISDSDIAANDELVKAKAAVYQAELRRYTQSRMLQRQLNTAMEEEARAEDERLKREQEIAKRRTKAEYDVAIAAKEAQVLATKHYEDRFHRELELELLRREALLSNQELLEEERQAIIEKSENKILELKKKAIEEERKEWEKQLEERREREALIVEETNTFLQNLFGARYLNLEANMNRELGGVKRTEQAKLAEIEKNLRRGVISEKQAESQRMQLREETEAKTTAIKREAFEKSKKMQIAETMISTFQSAVRAFNALAEIKVIGPLLGAAAAAAAVAFGLYQVKQIRSQEPGFAEGGLVPGYARGGLSGMRIGPHHGIPVKRSNGDNLLATVKTGEVILNERQQAALGGARTFRAIGVPGFAGGGLAGMAATSTADSRARIAAQDLRIEQALREVKPVLVLQDFEAASEAKNAPIQQAQVI